LTDLILRVILAYILVNYIGSTGIWISWPIGWTLAAVLSTAAYRKGIWRREVKEESR